MGTEVQCKSYLGGHNPMKDLSDDCNGNGWNLFHGQKNLGNEQYYTTFIQRSAADAHTGHDNDGLKRKMLEHDAIFKNQVHELHRLYRTQRDMMEDIKTKEGHRHEDLIEQSLSSCLQGSQHENGRKLCSSRYPLVGSVRSKVPCTENMSSPMSCTKGNAIFSSQFSSQNVCTKDYEVSEARPSKVRRKLIDLQLPANEYIDTKDSEKDTKAFDFSSLTSNQECELRLESNMKLSVNQKVCNSVSDTRISIGLADLNEPVEVGEATKSSSIKIFGHSAWNGAVEGTDLPAKPNSGFLDLPRDGMQKPGPDRKYSLNNFLVENNANGSKSLPFSYEAEYAGGSINLVLRRVQQDKLSLHATPSKVLSQDCRREVHFSNHGQETPRKERTGWGLEGFHRSQDYANHSHREPIADSQPSNLYRVLGSSGVAHTRPQITSPWGKPTDMTSSPNLTSFISQNSSQGLNKTLQLSSLNNDILREKWYASNISHSNPGISRDPPSCNGLYHGSSSRSKDLPAFGFDNLICRRSDNIASSSLVNHGIGKVYMASSCIDTKPLKDLSLNETFRRKTTKEALPHQDFGIIDGKRVLEDHKPLLPWLQANPASKNKASSPDKNVILISSSSPSDSQSSLYGKSETSKDLKGMINPTSSTNHGFWPKNETYETQCVKKILGVTICEKLGASENEASSLESFTPERQDSNKVKKNFLIDINVACDASLLESGDDSDVEEVVIDKKLDKSSSARNFIDLNSYATEDEDLPTSSGTSNIAPIRFVADFNLEEPAVPEDEDIFVEKEKEQTMLPQHPNAVSEQLDYEVLMSAAETIVDISSCPDETQEISILPLPDAAELDCLLWFADVAFTADKLESMSGKECSPSKEMDDFEAMALLLQDTKEEDYMPKPFVPDVQFEETGGSSLTTRPRRGQARRGRQRRDFQRDILPGLVTLSRHEMMEDFQTFEGLMKATGHSWNPGSTKRNGGTRGRRRKAVELAHDSAPIGGCTQQMNNVETSLEDRKSLTGWGKTTRRPRRQRCHASNASTVALT